MLNVAVLASGSGSNFETIMHKIQAGVLDVCIKVVVCNRPQAGVIERAKKFGVPCVVLDHKDTAQFPTREAFDTFVVQSINQHGADFVVLAGYMRLLTAHFLAHFPQRVVNIHPALLPSFPGVDGGGDALAYGVQIAGCTVHFVEEVMDSGPIIIQAAVPVIVGEAKEALMQRIHAVEHRIYPQALQWIAEGRIRCEGRKILFTPMLEKQAPQPDNTLVNPPLEVDF